MARFYRLLLDDYSAASFTSFDKDYFGTLEDIDGFFKAIREDEDTVERFQDILSVYDQYLAGNKKVTHNVAYRDVPFLQFCELTAFTTVRMQAQSDRINYLYDYGDGWEVSIELTQDYYANDLEGQDGSVIRAVLDGYAPVCIAADGLPVFDDVGGVGGYIDFLTTIHRSEDEEVRGQAREWASSLGWTGRAIKPQNLL